MGLHHLARRLMQNQIGKIELHDAVQAGGKITEKLIQLAMRSDSFRKFQKRLIMALLKFDSPCKKSGFGIELVVLSGCDFCWFVDCCLAPHGSIPACEASSILLRVVSQI